MTDVNISKIKKLISNERFRAMYKRYSTWTDKSTLNKIYVEDNKAGEYVSKVQFEDMIKRVLEYPKGPNVYVNPNGSNPLSTQPAVKLKTDYTYCLNTTLKVGSRGECVKYLQTMLTKYGFYTAAIDGSYGGITESAVKRFQTATNHTSDGVCGPKTWSSVPAYDGTTSRVSTVTSDGWVLTGTYASDFQDTSYTCGPSSLQMVFSALGRTVYESYLAKLGGTTTAGTSHGGLATAVRSVDSSVRITEYSYAGIGINGVAEKLKGNCEFIIHIRTETLTKDAYGNSVWVNDYGHYIFLVGVNPTKGLFRVFDPTKGLKDFTVSQIKTATAQGINQNSFICHCK